MNFKNLSDYDLTQRLEKLVRTERKITHVILLHINEVEARKLYAELGFDGMFSYLTKHLGYSESSAYRRLQSARLLKQIPSVAEKLESGALNLSQLTQVQKCIKEELRTSGKMLSQVKTENILKEIEHKNTFETQKVLAVEFNQPVQVTEVLKPQANETVRLELILTKEDFEELQKAKELLSHVCPNGSWSEVISTLAKRNNKSKLGISWKESKSKSADTKTSTQSFAATVTQENHANRRNYLSVKTQRPLLSAANHRCQFKTKTGQICGSTYQLQVDHIFPKALGGSDDPANLRILCRTHNNLMAKRFGLVSQNKLNGWQKSLFCNNDQYLNK